MAIDRDHDKPWTRRHDDPRTALFSSVTEIVYPKSLAELVELCKNRPPGVRYKAAGSHWALSGAAISDDTFIETHDPRGVRQVLGRTLHDVVPGCLHPDLIERMKSADFIGMGTLCHVEAGKRICQLYAELDETDPCTDPSTLGGFMKQHHGVDHFAGPWGFATLGGAGGQTVVGAFSTGTHGGDFDQGPLTDSVMAIHLVADGGRHYWIERVDERWAAQLTDDALLTARYDRPELGGPGNFTVIRETDNRMLNAVLVSAGRFGVIYSVVLRAEPQYALWERRRLHLWQDVRQQIGKRQGPLFTDTAPGHTSAPQGFLQISVSLTPHLNFGRNLVGVTKRWRMDLDTAPEGRAQRVGARVNNPVEEQRNQAPVYQLVGRSFPYTPDEDHPYRAEGPGFLDRACSNGSFLKGVLEEAYREIEELVESGGAVVAAGVAAVAGFGGGGLLALLPALALALLVLKALLDAFDSDDRLGEHLDGIRNALLDPSESDPAKRAAGLFAWQLISYKVFAEMQGDLEFGARSYAVLDRWNYLDRSCGVNVDSVEVFFDASDDRLIAFVDALIAFEVNQEFRGKACVGWVSLRFTGRSDALLGMQQHETTCSIEVAGLRDVTGTQELIDHAVRLALNPNMGGVLHWGQRNDSGRADVERLFGDRNDPGNGRLGAWRRALAVITDDNRLDGFSSRFTRRTGLEV
ncbi:hypothetical protein [Streptomyces sp. NPDC086023]|uniref:hypothetical protein n=1 Tax=Streptomyces sp. NPDC086023 TaxID=3365746 RepID=UPI0037CF6454